LKAERWDENLRVIFFLDFFLEERWIGVAGRRGGAGVKRREVKRHWGVRMEDKRGVDS
jgi:hypothetical protein